MEIKRIIKFFEKLNNGFAIIAEILVMLIMFLIVAEIIGRFIFDYPIPGQAEIVTLSLVVIVYLALPYTQMQEGHIRVDVFISKVKGAQREFLEAFILIIGLATSLMMLWATGNRAIESVQDQEFIIGFVNFPIWPGRCSVMFGFLLLSLVIAVQFISRLINGLDLINKGDQN